jgi:microcystin-dependent protein
MKKSFLFLFFLVSLLPLSNLFAQANVQSTGISIQGIARDENNSALSNIDALGLTFKIYYLDGSNNEVTILNQTANVKTDNFGVFSYVMSIDKSLFTAISNSQAYLKVTQASVVFSNEKLQAVPYAIQAQNGVPTGTIMAYVGTTAPVGWLMCDGAPFPDNLYYAQLKSLLGSTNAPDLKGLFLRGVGDATGYTGKTGPSLKTVQADGVAAHNHGVGTLLTAAAGDHAHTIARRQNPDSGAYDTNDAHKTENSAATTDRANLGNFNTSSSGNHTHTLTGTTANTGITETRPINYGVNYIIKI